jgi:prepilin-type N-terminal cleavage/methylation domain-containing protein
MLARLRKAYARARADAGFGMIELLIAMIVISVGILAIFAMFNSGMVQIRRASSVSTSAALAESELEQYRALEYDAIGLVDSQVTSADAKYKGDTAYKTDSPTTTLSANVTTITQTALTVPASTPGFPTSAPFRIKIDSEIMLVTAMSGTTWTVDDSQEGRASPDTNTGRSKDGTTAATHNSGATITLKNTVGLPACASPATLPCTNTAQSVPTKTVTGADHKSYRLDTYMTWQTQGSSAGTNGRQVKLVTIIVRDNTSPYRIYARVASSFDKSTGLSIVTT